MSVTSERLLACRKALGMKQYAVEKEAGMNRHTLGGYECGRREPGAHALRKLSRIYGVTSDYLLGLSDTKNDGGN